MTQELATFALTHLDLTSLNDNDTEETVVRLAQRAISDKGACAAVCVWPEFVKIARENLAQTVHVAAVANFPTGSHSLDAIYKEVTTALDAGASEIDLVLPYKMLIAGVWSEVAKVLKFVRDLTFDYGRNIKLKVILETGALEEHPNKDDLICEAVVLSLQHGADFIKTSTGKHPVGATPYAVEKICQLLSVYKDKFPNVGVKVSGGIKTLEDVELYANIVKKHLGEDALTADKFRIGASSLMNSIEATLSGVNINADKGSSY